jgi:hypothetical protein
MNTMKALMLAAATVLSLGAGVAMAQGEMPSSGEGAYFSQRHQAAPQSSSDDTDRLQSGSSDVAPTHSGATQIPNWQTLPNFTDPG